jgi:2-oxoisovalerate dehydrogenase E1 component
MPWDRETVLASVAQTHRCLIVHEDTMTAGFGAEIAAQLAHEAFGRLEAPVERLALPDIPVPHSPILLDSVLPAVASIVTAIRRIASY